MPPRRDQKRKREENLRELMGDISISHASLRRVLKTLNDEGLSNKSLNKAYWSRYKEVAVCDDLVTLDGNPVRWHSCDPGRLVQYMVSQSPKLMDAYAAAANQHDSEWGVVVVFDEFVPGDKLKANNRKKAMSLWLQFY